MCARRFLIVIFILTLLTVGGAFAVYQWGSQLLVRSATPRGHYVAPAADTGPDYALAASWIARPGLPQPANPSLWRPDNWPPPTLQMRDAATFFIHPTTYLERDRWNALLDDRESQDRAALFVRSQASAFNGVSEVWAPKYRQAAYGAFLLKSADANKALDLAYGDVKRAFDRFLAAQPPGRPIFLAGHSQGSLHLLRLLGDRQDALKGRLVAAYVVGWPVGIQSDLPATGLTGCATPDQSGCVISWQSFRDPANPSLVTNSWVGTRGFTGTKRSRDDMICTNPISGTPGPAPAAANAGTLLPTADLSRARLEPGRVGARCDDGFLMIDGDIPAMGPFVLPGNNYHVYDYALFWGAIRNDAARRLAAWRR